MGNIAVGEALGLSDDGSDGDDDGRKVDAAMEGKDDDAKDGRTVGPDVGVMLVLLVGEVDVAMVGRTDGLTVVAELGETLGDDEGWEEDGTELGSADGDADGSELGSIVGREVGSMDGMKDGLTDGLKVLVALGVEVGGKDRSTVGVLDGRTDGGREGF